MHFNTLTHVMSDCVNRVSTTNLVSIDLRLLTLDTELELLLKKTVSTLCFTPPLVDRHAMCTM